MPDRFNEDNPNYNPVAFIPFGDGPRTCIGREKLFHNMILWPVVSMGSVLGLRMGKMVTKIGLVMLLQKYDFECLKKDELEFDNHSVTLVLRGGIDLKVTHRK